MPHITKAHAPVLVDSPVLEGRYLELGELTVSFETFHADADGAPMFVGLPDDRCQCPHWGVVLSGPYTLRYAHHEEVYDTGEVFYAPPGHTPIVTAGSEIVHFSPTDQLGRTQAVLAQNMAGASGP